MKKAINGKVYNTEKSRLLCSIVLGSGDVEALYFRLRGLYFVVACGPSYCKAQWTIFADTCDAKQWALEHAGHAGVELFEMRMR